MRPAVEVTVEKWNALVLWSWEFEDSLCPICKFVLFLTPGILSVKNAPAAKHNPHRLVARAPLHWYF
jgi:hypothetical protein